MTCSQWKRSIGNALCATRANMPKRAFFTCWASCLIVLLVDALVQPRARGFGLRRHNVGIEPRILRSMAVMAPPIGDMKTRAIDYTKLCDQVYVAVERAVKDGKDRMSVQFPPDEGPTLVRRYEFQLGFAYSLLKRARAESVEQVGKKVLIRDNIDIRGGGEYLSEEGLFGLHAFFRTKLGGRACGLKVVMNSGLDASACREADKFLGQDPLLLLNCNLDKMSFFDRLGKGAFFDSFTPVYYCARVRGAFLLYVYPGRWQLFGITGGKFEVLFESDSKPDLFDLEKKLIGLGAA